MHLTVIGAKWKGAEYASHVSIGLGAGDDAAALEQYFEINAGFIRESAVVMDNHRPAELGKMEEAGEHPCAELPVLCAGQKVNWNSRGGLAPERPIPLPNLRERVVFVVGGIPAAFNVAADVPPE